MGWLMMGDGDIKREESSHHFSFHHFIISHFSLLPLAPTTIFKKQKNE